MKRIVLIFISAYLFGCGNYVMLRGTESQNDDWESIQQWNKQNQKFTCIKTLYFKDSILVKVITEKSKRVSSGSILWRTTETGLEPSDGSNSGKRKSWKIIKHDVTYQKYSIGTYQEIHTVSQGQDLNVNFKSAIKISWQFAVEPNDIVIKDNKDDQELLNIEDAKFKQGSPFNVPTGTENINVCVSSSSESSSDIYVVKAELNDERVFERTVITFLGVQIWDNTKMLSREESQDLIKKRETDDIKDNEIQEGSDYANMYLKKHDNFENTEPKRVWIKHSEGENIETNDD